MDVNGQESGNFALDSEIDHFIYQLYDLTNNEAVLYFRVDIFLPLLRL